MNFGVGEAPPSWRTSDEVSLNRTGTALVWKAPLKVEVKRPTTYMALARQFTSLGSPGAPTERYVDFAATFGPLDLCSHGIPRGHMSPVEIRRADGAVIDEHLHRGQRLNSRIEEDLMAWRALAAQGRAITRLADDLANDAATSQQDWDPLRPLLPALETIPLGESGASRSDESGLVWNPPSETIELQRRAVALCVEKWLRWGQVGVDFVWVGGDKRPRSELGSSTLFGAIAIGIAEELSRDRGGRVCAGCGDFFVPDRWRDPYKLAWCRKCRFKVRKAAEARRRRALRRVERESRSRQ